MFFFRKRGTRLKKLDFYLGVLLSVADNTFTNYHLFFKNVIIFSTRNTPKEKWALDYSRGLFWMVCQKWHHISLTWIIKNALKLWLLQRCAPKYQKQKYSLKMSSPIDNEKNLKVLQSESNYRSFNEPTPCLETRSFFLLMIVSALLSNLFNEENLWQNHEKQFSYF